MYGRPLSLFMSPDSGYPSGHFAPSARDQQASPSADSPSMLRAPPPAAVRLHSARTSSPPLSYSLFPPSPRQPAVDNLLVSPPRSRPSWNKTETAVNNTSRPCSPSLSSSSTLVEDNRVRGPLATQEARRAAFRDEYLGRREAAVTAQEVAFEVDLEGALGEEEVEEVRGPNWWRKLKWWQRAILKSLPGVLVILLIVLILVLEYNDGT
ncbi:hypothetical protein K402DRAFT_450858 [Aulographum hederae CBS 113979]|uniref:Uncharacterized protein n=1 Tax=Aulographum hederae CBS 113979 TaxID=1176131 RepID=A0A6G1HDU9_9PEZI|nr:hypothetical protein K402DRAFT_450858 [Aulographum hederae CBS 113979]